MQVPSGIVCNRSWTEQNIASYTVFSYFYASWLPPRLSIYILIFLISGKSANSNNWAVHPVAICIDKFNYGAWRFIISFIDHAIQIYVGQKRGVHHEIKQRTRFLIFGILGKDSRFQKYFEYI